MFETGLLSLDTTAAKNVCTYFDEDSSGPMLQTTGVSWGPFYEIGSLGRLIVKM
jgi:hypothetical protein